MARRYATVQEISRLFGYSSATVLRWARSGKIEARRGSWQYLIPFDQDFPQARSYRKKEERCRRK